MGGSCSYKRSQKIKKFDTDALWKTGERAEFQPKWVARRKAERPGPDSLARVGGGIVLETDDFIAGDENELGNSEQQAEGGQARGRKRFNGCE